MLSSEQPVALQRVVSEAMHHADALDAVREIYRRLQLEINERKPVCVASGKCCHFEAYGHRLYVTTLELAAFKQDLDAFKTVERPLDAGSSEDLRTGVVSLQQAPTLNTGACLLQIGARCGVHAIRPFGCRIFYCDSSATDWQQQQYEIFHAEIKQLHERFNIDYLYVEWRAALSALSIVG